MTDREKDREQALRIILVALLVLVLSWFCLGLREGGTAAPRNPSGQPAKKVPE